MALAAPRSARHWVYVDAQRTHEVHAQLAHTPAHAVFVTTEFPMGSHEPAEMVQAQTPIAGEEELVGLLRDLEDRLALAGRYFRTEAGAPRWTPLPPATRPVDLRAHEAPVPGMEAIGGKMRFHHFHPKEGRDRLLISMPRPGMSGRHVLAEVRFDFPRVDEGELEVLHARLAPAVLASAVAKEHVEAPRKGFRKLLEARDYEHAYGAGWADKASAMFKRAAARLVGGHAPAPAAPPADPHAPPELDRVKAALATSRVEALKSRFVDAVTEARLVESGEHAIRRYVNSLRKKMDHRLAYDLSIFEAALLLEYAIPAQMWDLAHDEGGKLLRYTHGYRRG